MGLEWWNVPYSETQYSSHEWYLACHILFILSILSFFLDSFVFISYLLFKHKFPSRLITYFSLTSSLNAAAWVLLFITEGKVLQSKVGCTFQGILNQFFSSATMLWWLCITLNLYATFVKNRKIAHYETHMHVFCWGGALIMTISPTLASRIGVVGLWCWVSDFRWQFYSYYLIMGICCVVGGFMWICIIYSISRLTRKYKLSDKSAVSVHVVRQSIFVIWFLFVFCFMFIHRFYQSDHKDTPFWLLMFHLVAMASQGVMVFLIFGLRVEIACFWRSLLYKCCISKCAERDGYSSLD